MLHVCSSTYLSFDSASDDAADDAADGDDDDGDFDWLSFAQWLFVCSKLKLLFWSRLLLFALKFKFKFRLRSCWLWSLVLWKKLLLIKLLLFAAWLATTSSNCSASAFSLFRLLVALFNSSALDQYLSSSSSSCSSVSGSKKFKQCCCCCCWCCPAATDCWSVLLPLKPFWFLDADSWGLFDLNLNESIKLASFGFGSVRFDWVLGGQLKVYLKVSTLIITISFFYENSMNEDETLWMIEDWRAERRE